MFSCRGNVETSPGIFQTGTWILGLNFESGQFLVLVSIIFSKEGDMHV